MFHRLVLSAGLACFANSVLADHFQEATHLRYWQRTDRVFHTMASVGTPKELPPASEDRRPSALIEEARDLLRRSAMYSLLLLERGRIVFEDYARTADRDHKLTSFSVAKSLTALAVGEALCAGKIRNLDDKVEVYAQSVAGTAFGRASIRNALRMASGASFAIAGDGVNYEDFLQVIQGKLSILEYLKKYGAQARRFGTPVKDGEVFHYNGLNTESLAFVVEGATGTPFHKWFESTVWKKSGMEGQGHWLLDKEGKAAAEAFFMATTRDYARIALTTLEHMTGKSGDACLIKFLHEATTPLIATSDRSMPGYGYQIWIDEGQNPWFIGHGGQMIGFHVKSERILVTLGHKYSREGVLNLFNRWMSAN